MENGTKKQIIRELALFKNSPLNLENTPILIKLLAEMVNNDVRIVKRVCEELEREGVAEFMLDRRYLRLK